MPSENGWEPARANAAQCEWVRIPGAEHVSLQILKGQPLAILRAWAADYHAYIEPLRDADSACYTPTNSVDTSNHLNGTAMDLNWQSHPFHEKGTFTPAQMKTLHELLDFYEDTIYWGGDWTSPIDEMHWQMGYSTYDEPHTEDFIDRKIRADGFSTFRRREGGQDAAPVLSEAMGDRLSMDRYRELLPAVAESLRACKCTTMERVAMWCAQIGHESEGLYYTEEIASGEAYEGRCDDLGNCQPGDGVRFKGRSWIQITGRHNYTELSQWAHGKDLVSSPTFFVDHPHKIASDEYAGLGAAWYWIEARPQINGLCDARDLESVTRAINGGLNGISDRRTRYNRALGMGDQLLTLLDGEGNWLDMPGNAEKLDYIYNELHKLFGSRSPYRHDDNGFDSLAGRLLDTERQINMAMVETAARSGEAWALDLVSAVASGSDEHAGNWLWYTDSDGNRKKDEWAIQHARHILNAIEATNPDVLRSHLAQKGQA